MHIAGIRLVSLMLFILKIDVAHLKHHPHEFPYLRLLLLLETNFLHRSIDLMEVFKVFNVGCSIGTALFEVTVMRGLFRSKFISSCKGIEGMEGTLAWRYRYDSALFE
jgi:hypothetical protein